jgi:uncharacterized repeat protein (TIGR01451 family)
VNGILKKILALALLPVVLAGCDLTKTASPNQAAIGQPVTFTIVLTNELDFVSGTDQIIDTLPAGVQFVSASSDQGTCTESGGTVTCDVFVAESGTATVTIVVTPTQCGNFTNTAEDTASRSPAAPQFGISPLTATASFTVPCTSPTAPTAAAPTCPPPTQEFSERRIQSGGASPSTGVSNAGDNANLSPTSQQTANTGNVANEQGVVQSCSETGDVDLSGSSLTISPSTASESTQTIDQSAAS